MTNPIIQEALTWLDTPYHHQGRIKGAGVDCIMLLAEVYHACGLIPYVDPRPYPMDWHLHRGEEKYLEGILQYADRVTDPQPGDVVLYKFGRCISHGGIVIAWPTILHAYMPERAVVLSHGEAGELEGRLAGFCRVREGVPA